MTHNSVLKMSHNGESSDQVGNLLTKKNFLPGGCGGRPDGFFQKQTKYGEGIDPPLSFGAVGNCWKVPEVP